MSATLSSDCHAFTRLAHDSLDVIQQVVSLRGRTALQDYRGLAKPCPGHAIALSIALLSLTGIPPLIGFSAKLALFGAVIDAGYGWLALLAVLNTVVSLFYYLRVIAPMFFAAQTPVVALLGWRSRASLWIALGALLITSGATQIILAGAHASAFLPGSP